MNFKRLLSWVICVAMLLSLIPSGAFPLGILPIFAAETSAEYIVIDACETIGNGALDTDDYMAGVGCYSYAGKEFVGFTNNYDLTLPNDWRDYYLDLWMYISDPSKLTGGSGLEISQVVDNIELYWELSSLGLKAGWNKLQLPLTNGGADFLTLKTIRLFVVDLKLTEDLVVKVDNITLSKGKNAADRSALNTAMAEAAELMKTNDSAKLRRAYEIAQLAVSQADVDAFAARLNAAIRSAENGDSDYKIVDQDGTIYETEDYPVYRYSIYDFISEAQVKAGADCTAAAQQAINLLSNERTSGTDNGKVDGGTLYFPAGEYTFRGTLLLAKGVTILGDWAMPTESNKAARGTIFKVYSGRGSTDGAASFITMKPNSCVRNLNFWYPEQDPSNIVAYPPTIITSSFNTWGADYMHVKNVTLVNSYTGIVSAIPANGQMPASPTLRHIYGSPLHEAVVMDGIVDIGRFDYMEFSPEYWVKSGLAGSPAENNTAYKNYLRNNAIGVSLGRIDWSYLTYTKVSGYNQGVRFRPSIISTGGYPNGQCYRLTLEDCEYAIYNAAMSNCGELLSFIDINNCTYGIYSERDASVSETYIDGSLEVAQIDIKNTTYPIAQKSPGQLAIVNGTISGGASSVSDGVIALTNVDFTNGATLRFDEGCVYGIVSGCRNNGTAIAAGNAMITDNTQNCVTVDKTRVDVDTLSYIEGVAGTTYIKDFEYNYDCKPAKSKLYVVTADTTGNTDATAAIQAQLTAAGDNGGGVVFVPPGEYKIANRLTIPSGVELKGAVDIGRNPIRLGTIFQVTWGKGNENAGAAVTLSANSGIRGIVFNQPEQDFGSVNSIHPYPYCIQGNGENIYIINIGLRGVYNGIDLASVRCNNHYVEYLSGMAMKTVIQVGGGATGGTICNTQMNLICLTAGYESKFGSWPNKPNGTLDNSNAYLTAMDNAVNTFLYVDSEVMVIGDVDDEMLFDNFSYSGRYGVYFKAENGGGDGVPDGWLIGQGVDSGIKSIQVEALGSMPMINTQLVAINRTNYTQEEANHIVLAEGFDGEVQMYNTALWGHAGEFADVDSGTLNMYNSSFCDFAPANVGDVESDAQFNLVNAYLHANGKGLEATNKDSVTATNIFSTGALAGLSDYDNLSNYVRYGYNWTFKNNAQTAFVDYSTSTYGKIDNFAFGDNSSEGWITEKEGVTVAAFTGYLYVNVADSYIGATDNEVEVRITYWDEAGGNVTLHYNSTGEDYKYTATPRTGTGAWRTVVFNLTDASFRNAQNIQCDFRIAANNGDTPIYVSKVEVINPNVVIEPEPEEPEEPEIPDETSGNPIITTMFTADPSAHVFGDRLYLYPSHDLYPNQGCDLMNKYHVFSTSNMVDWVDEGQILSSDDAKTWSSCDGFMWAPDCVYNEADGKYYFYYPHPETSNWNTTWRVGVAVGDTPVGPFTDLGCVKNPDGTNFESMIDPCVFQDDDGSVYLFVGGGASVCYGKLSADMYSLEGEMTYLSGITDFHEGAWVFKRGDMYYLMYADNNAGYNRQRYATATSIHGPWTYRGVVLEANDCDTSHASIAEYKGEWYMFYHNSNLSNGIGPLRSVCVDKVTFNNDGTMKLVAQTTTGVDAVDYSEQVSPERDANPDPADYTTVIYNANVSSGNLTGKDTKNFSVNVSNTTARRALVTVTYTYTGNSTTDAKVYSSGDVKGGMNDGDGYFLPLPKGTNATSQCFVTLANGSTTLTFGGGRNSGNGPETYTISHITVKVLPDSSVVDKSELARALRYYDNDAADNCTAASVTAYTNALKAAQDVYDNASATQTQANNALTALKNAEAALVANTYTLTLSTSPAGVGSVKGGGTYASDTVVPITATQVDGYLFAGWYDAAGNCVSRNIATTALVTANTTLTARYVEYITIGKGTTRVEAEAFFTAIAGTQDGGFGVQREQSSDVDGTQNVGYLENGEWMEYAVYVEKDGYYTFNVRSASPDGGGRVSLLLDGDTLATKELAKTGDWQIYADNEITDKVWIKAGRHVFRLNVDVAGVNLNWVEFDRFDVLKIEAEGFTESCGESQVGGALGIHVEGCGDVGGTEDVGFIDNGDWTKYSVTIETPGYYTFSLRAATPNEGEREVSLQTNTNAPSSANQLSKVTVSQTNTTDNWQIYNTFTSEGTFYLSAGTHDLYLYAVTGGQNWNWFQLELQEADEIALVDKSALKAALDEAITDFTSFIDGVEEYEAALEAAQTVYDDPKATQLEVNAALQALQEATAALVVDGTTYKATATKEASIDGAGNVVNMHIEGATAIFSGIDGGTGGKAIVTLYYATENQNVTLNAWANDGDEQVLTLPTTGAWDAFTGTVTFTVDLEAGTDNTIYLEHLNEGANLSHIVVVPTVNEEERNDWKTTYLVDYGVEWTIANTTLFADPIAAGYTALTGTYNGTYGTLVVGETATTYTPKAMMTGVDTFVFAFGGDRLTLTLSPASSVYYEAGILLGFTGITSKGTWQDLSTAQFLETVLTTANAVANDPYASQRQVDAATASLLALSGEGNTSFAQDVNPATADYRGVEVKMDGIKQTWLNGNETAGIVEVDGQNAMHISEGGYRIGFTVDPAIISEDTRDVTIYVECKITTDNWNTRMLVSYASYNDGAVAGKETAFQYGDGHGENRDGGGYAMNEWDIMTFRLPDAYFQHNGENGRHYDSDFLFGFWTGGGEAPQLLIRRIAVVPTEQVNTDIATQAYFDFTNKVESNPCIDGYGKDYAKNGLNYSFNGGEGEGAIRANGMVMTNGPLYFPLDDPSVFGAEVQVKVYTDANNANVVVQYNSSDTEMEGNPDYKEAARVVSDGLVTFTITDAAFTNKQNAGASFRIYANGAVIKCVEVVAKDSADKTALLEAIEDAEDIEVADVKLTMGDPSDVYGQGGSASLENNTAFGFGDILKGVGSVEGTTLTVPFTGTGIDLYAMIDGTAGEIRVLLKDGNGKLIAARYIDAGFDYSTLYQTPVAQFKDLAYGSYTVELYVYPAGNKFTGDRCTLYLDGVRVYQPMGDVSYGEEGNVQFISLRDILLKESELTDNVTSTGVAFVADDEYKEYGPKAEVYLAAGQSLTFHVTGNYTGLQIGMHAANGVTSTAKVLVNGEEIAVNSTMDMYYKIEKADGDTYVITNSGTTDTLISLTQLKLTGVSGTVSLDVTEQALSAATAQVEQWQAEKAETQNAAEAARQQLIAQLQNKVPAYV